MLPEQLFQTHGRSERRAEITPLNLLKHLIVEPWTDSKAVVDNLPTAVWVRDVFGYTSATLKRLIVDMPFDSLPPWNDHLNVGPVLVEGFERLARLEEFVCTRNAARLRVRNQEGDLVSILYRWPHLRRLALNRPSCDMDFWECIADMPHLNRAVFTGAMESIGEGVDFRKVYNERARVESTLTVVLAEIRKHIVIPADDQAGIFDRGDDRIQLMSVKIQVPKLKHFLDSNSEWLMGTSLAGELWNIDGQRIKDAPQLVDPHPHLQIAELE